MRRVLFLVMCMLAVTGIYAVEPAAIDLMKSVLGHEVVATNEAEQVNYYIDYGAWTNESDVVVEYGAIQNWDDVENRRASGVLAYLGGNIVTNPQPMTEFCFGMRRSNEVVRIDFEPKCWVGQVTRLSAPVLNSGDAVVSVRYSCCVISNRFSRYVEVEDQYSLGTMALVNHREIKELQYDFVNGFVRIYKDGVLEDSEEMESVDGKVQVVASGFVRDENGNAVADQDVQIDWVLRVLNMASLDNREKKYSKVLTTDANGYFELGIRESSACHIRIDRAGYIGLEFNHEQYSGRPQLPPLDIKLTPIPAGATNIGENLSWMVGQRKIEMKSLLACREVGLSLDTYRDDGDTYVKGWTTNRDDADIWFELGGTDAEFAEHFERCMTTNHLKTDWAEWPLKITGLRGTQIKEAPDQPSPGMARDMQWTLCEADTNGYVNELNGLARRELWLSRGYDWQGKSLFSSNFYLEKEGRYGRLIGLVFDIWGEGKMNPPQNGQKWTDIGMKIRFENLNMQTTNLNHRVLQRL